MKCMDSSTTYNRSTVMVANLRKIDFQALMEISASLQPVSIISLASSHSEVRLMLLSLYLKNHRLRSQGIYRFNCLILIDIAGLGCVFRRVPALLAPSALRSSGWNNVAREEPHGE